MPVPNNSEKMIKIHRDSNYNPTWPPPSPSSLSSSQNQNEQQEETRTWSSQTVTKRVTSSSSENPTPITHQTTTSSKSSDLFSNAHDRRGSATPTTSSLNNSQTNTMRSSSLVKNALSGIEDGSFGRDNVSSPSSFSSNNNTTRRDSKTTTFRSEQVIPASTPSMEIVPSNGDNTAVSPWRMGTDAGGDVPLTYEIITLANGKKEFQLLLTAKQFSPEDLQVKLTDNTLFISGNHEERSPNGAYKQKSFYRSCTIPPGVRPEDLNCSLDSVGRLKITAPVPDPEKNQHTSTKTITTTQHQRDWKDHGIVPSGFKVAPGSKEQVITVWNDNGDKIGNNSSNVRKQETKTTTKTVRSFKTVA